MKEQICAQFETLLQNEDITAVKAEAKSLQNDYKAETAKEKQIQEEAWKQLEHEEGEEFEYQVNPLDERFEALVDRDSSMDTMNGGRKLAKTRRRETQKRGDNHDHYNEWFEPCGELFSSVPFFFGVQELLSKSL